VELSIDYWENYVKVGIFKAWSTINARW